MSDVEQDVGSSASWMAEAATGIPGVVAVSLGGSHATGLADAASDIDLHVYWRGELPPGPQRAAVLAAIPDPGTTIREETAWGPEDHLVVDGRPAELVYVDLDDVIRQVERARTVGLDDEGFATAVLHSVASGIVLEDGGGELAAARATLADYPEATHRRLVRTLPHLLRSYLAQLTKAQGRGDLLFVQHRRYSLQMVYFNLLFALNRRYHPGEKRLAVHGERCPVRPVRQGERWAEVTALSADDVRLVVLLGELTEDLIVLTHGPGQSRTAGP